jgi:hypothetical protein
MTGSDNPGALHHLHNALNHLSGRQTPDYANSIKESISAVESTCRAIAGKSGATLGNAIKTLEAGVVTIHPALQKAWGSLYGYTNDAEGVRHAANIGPGSDVEDAIYFPSVLFGLHQSAQQQKGTARRLGSAARLGPSQPTRQFIQLCRAQDRRYRGGVPAQPPARRWDALHVQYAGDGGGRHTGRADRRTAP